MLVAQLLRKYCAFPLALPNQQARLSARRLRLVEDYIQAGLASRLTLEDLSASIHMSAYHFARIFKATTGQTPHAYVTRLRIERARELLRTSRCSMPAIARRVGFASKSHFAATFLRLTGISPHLFRSATSSETSDRDVAGEFGRTFVSRSPSTKRAGIRPQQQVIAPATTVQSDRRPVSVQHHACTGQAMKSKKSEAELVAWGTRRRFLTGSAANDLPSRCARLYAGTETASLDNASRNEEEHSHGSIT